MSKQSITKRSDGRYRRRVGDKYFYGDTITEVNRKVKQYQLEQEQHLVHELTGLTTAEYAARWLPIHRHRSCTKSYNLYSNILNNFCGSYNKLMSKVTRSDIVEFYNTLEGYSQSHIDKHVATITGMFSSAVEDGVILKSPCTGAEPPEGTKGSHRALDPWEDALVKELVSHRFGPAVILMRYAGLRRGEVLSFDIDRDCDFKKLKLYVREARSFSESHRGTTKTTKTEAGIRSVPMFPPVYDVLKDLHGLVASELDGSPMTESAFRGAWNSWCTAFEEKINGCQKRWYKGDAWKECTIRTHDFRHSFCTMICTAGVDIKTAMSWMGHSDEAMIRKIYDHLTESRENDAVNRVKNLLG